MKKHMQNSLNFSFIIVALTFFITACSADEGSIFETPQDTGQDGMENMDGTDEVATLIFNESDPSKNILISEANGEVGSRVRARVIFTSSTTTQRRLYITQNIAGTGDMPFNDFDLGDTDLTKVLKADGSIDLDGANKKEIDFTFELPVPDVTNGLIVYSFWTTKGKGDFRDPTKRIALGVGTITVKVGAGTNPFATVRKFEGIKLFAPDQFGKTESFFSLLNETVYKINQGPEFRAFWDFGYYCGASGSSANDDASFASTKAYDASFGFDVEGLKPADTEEDMAEETLNEMFFAKSGKSTTDFDGIALASDLDGIDKSTNQKITNLTVDDVIEFVDNYGKKGLIKITAIQAGFGNNDFIEFSVKIQP
ncbi:hypothetical protein FEE95_02865 [Maribacter algarum]|uniref:DUF5017 domain-containing protein n=1 Tax=Maribacter algarum (ex Zhang et al. 2020) TaxID=2578118 RepID=A0A5S3PTQ5_9FLAO|nr:hypothetical protein [Maribacter algarum]TMM58389.1 hypothetical protein FEE95_02865 [Maribacter algarum]